MRKRRTSFAGALKEVRRPYRLFLLRALSELEEQSSAEFFPLSLIMTGAIQEGDIHRALRGLYSAGMVRAGRGGYGLTALGRRALVFIWASRRTNLRQGL